MGARRYKISVRVEHSNKNCQQATMYSCVNHINTTALCWQWKVNFINEWKQKDRQSLNEIVKCVDAKAQHEKKRWNTTKSNH